MCQPAGARALVGNLLGQGADLLHPQDVGARAWEKVREALLHAGPDAVDVPAHHPHLPPLALLSVDPRPATGWSRRRFEATVAAARAPATLAPGVSPSCLARHVETPFAASSTSGALNFSRGIRAHIRLEDAAAVSSLLRAKRTEQIATDFVMLLCARRGQGTDRGCTGEPATVRSNGGGSRLLLQPRIWGDRVDFAPAQHSGQLREITNYRGRKGDSLVFGCSLWRECRAPGRRPEPAKRRGRWRPGAAVTVCGESEPVVVRPSGVATGSGFRTSRARR